MPIDATSIIFCKRKAASPLARIQPLPLSRPLAGNRRADCSRAENGWEETENSKSRRFHHLRLARLQKSLPGGKAGDS
jgi:hypothetical protein